MNRILGKRPDPVLERGKEKAVRVVAALLNAPDVARLLLDASLTDAERSAVALSYLSDCYDILGSRVGAAVAIAAIDQQEEPHMGAVILAVHRGIQEVRKFSISELVERRAELSLGLLPEDRAAS